MSVCDKHDDCFGCEHEIARLEAELAEAKKTRDGWYDKYHEAQMQILTRTEERNEAREAVASACGVVWLDVNLAHDAMRKALKRWGMR